MITNLKAKAALGALYAALGLAAAGMLLPMIWMVLLSFKSNPGSGMGLKEIAGTPFTFTNYTEALGSDSFGLYFYNSVITALAVTAGNVIFCMFAGYAIARKKFPGKPLIIASILGVLIIPPHVVMIPLYRLMAEFGWINTYLALIVPWLVTPFGIFLVRQYLAGVPEEIEHAARIDGAGEARVLFRVVFPLCKPIITVLAIYTFLNTWNSFLFPFLFTNEPAYRTLPVGLAFYMGKQSIDWGHLMAGAGMSSLPILLIFLVFQKQIIRGMTAGALKE